MANYVLWNDTQSNNECCLTDFEGVEDVFALLAGRSLAESFPEGVRFLMDPDEPTEMLLSDSPTNTGSVILASQRLADFMKAQGAPAVEYLPVTVFDHKGRAVSDQFFILHPIDPVDCLDVEESEPSYSLIMEDCIEEVEQIVLDEEKIPADRVYFRCLNFDSVTLVRRDFAELIQQQGFGGFNWLELEDYEA